MTHRTLLTLCLLAVLGSTAHAQERTDVEPAGSVVTHPAPRPDCTAEDGCDGRTVTRGVDHFALPRLMAERALTANELAERRLDKLLECEARAERLRTGEPRWMTALRWTGFGVALGAAFAAGVMVAR